jgi:WD40 repeat protein
MFWFWRRVEQAHEQVSTQQELARVAQAREGRLRYLHQIHQVQRLQRKNQIERIEPFLDTMDPAHRAWEWQYLKTYCQTRVQVLDPDLVGGHRVHFMGNSQRVLLETMDHRLQIWNTLKREKVRDLVSAKVKVVRFALSPKGNLLATAQDDGMVRVWDLQTGAERISFGKFAAPPECLAFSADGQSLAFPARRTMPDGTVRSTFLMATLDSSKPPITQVMPAQILCVAPLGSGEWITGSDDRCLRIWRDGGVQRTMSGHTGDVIAVACPPRGNLIASAGSDHKIRFWDVAGRDLFEINAHTDRIKALCFAPDGSQLISASSDRTLRVWNARSGQAVLMLRFPEPLTSIDLSPDGQHLVSATAKTPVELWKAYWYESIMPTLSGRSIRSAARLPDGRWALLQSDRSLELLDVQSTPKTTPLRWNGKRPQEIAVCAATKMLAVGSEDSTVGLIDLKTESQANSFETNHQGGLHHLQFRPNGTQLATAGEEPVIKLWDPTSPRDPLILRGHSQRIKAIRFAPTGRWLATASEDRDVIIWDTNSGSEVKRLQIPSEKPTALAFSPDGKILAVGGSEGSIYVSMWGTGDELPTLRDHVGAINALVFTPEGDRLVSSGAELAIKFWDHTLGEETLTLLGHVRPILQMEFDVKDRSLNSVGDDLAIQSWQVQPVGK